MNKLLPFVTSRCQFHDKLDFSQWANVFLTAKKGQITPGEAKTGICIQGGLSRVEKCNLKLSLFHPRGPIDHVSIMPLYLEPQHSKLKSLMGTRVKAVELQADLFEILHLLCGVKKRGETHTFYAGLKSEEGVPLRVR